jgi:hypothetical protein
MKYKPGYLVDNVWSCRCGAMNAAYRTTCGKCDKPKTNINERI